MGDVRIYSVNKVIANLDRLHGQIIRIGCILNVEFEGNGILHVPQRDRLTDHRSFLPAQFSPELVWPAPELATRETYREIATYLESFRGRRVIVTATVDREEPGYMGFWPGSIVIRSINKWKAS